MTCRDRVSTPSLATVASFTRQGRGTGAVVLAFIVSRQLLALTGILRGIPEARCEEFCCAVSPVHIGGHRNDRVGTMGIRKLFGPRMPSRADTFRVATEVTNGLLRHVFLRLTFEVSVGPLGAAAFRAVQVCWFVEDSLAHTMISDSLLRPKRRTQKKRAQFQDDAGESFQLVQATSHRLGSAARYYRSIRLSSRASEKIIAYVANKFEEDVVSYLIQLFLRLIVITAVRMQPKKRPDGTS